MEKNGKVILTEESRAQLEAKYKELLEKSKEISKEIREAKDFGDLSENAEFTAAREAQSQIHAEMEEIKAQLDNHSIYVEDKKSKNTITIGTKVKYEVVDTKKVHEVKIVTIADTDPLANKISNESPLGKALIGNKKNAVVDFNTPGGAMQIRVLEISK